MLREEIMKTKDITQIDVRKHTKELRYFNKIINNASEHAVIKAHFNRKAGKAMENTCEYGYPSLEDVIDYYFKEKWGV